MKQLKILKRASDLVSVESYRSGTLPDITSYAEDFGREIDIEPLENVIRHAMGMKWERLQLSDGWLAPRVHATLRLYRDEAASEGIWHYLTVAVPAIRGYVNWRWGSEDDSRENGGLKRERILGPTNRNAIARLWWLAELTRNGSDYGPAALAGQNQDAVTRILDVDAFHSRPAALAYVRVLSTLRAGGMAGSKDAQDLGRELNHVLTTYVLETLAPEAGGSPDRLGNWVEDREGPNETMMYDRVPEGPDEDSVAEESVKSVEELLHRIWSEYTGVLASSAAGSPAS